MQKRFSFVSIIICLILCLGAKAQNFKTYNNDPINVKQFVLSNGLTVMLSENPGSSDVYGMVIVKAGGKNDPSDATGLAHYLEHMLFKGTQTMGTINYAEEKPYLDAINDLYEELGKTKADTARKKIQKEINRQSVLAAQYAIPNELDKVLAEIGSTGVNAFTTEDFTAYINSFPANQMEKWLDIYSHRFMDPVFRLFQAELETVYEEKNRSMDDGFSQVIEKFLANLYKTHPYGQQSIIGTTDHLKNPPLKKMYEYFNTYYVANNMALVLAGNFKSEEIIPIIEKKFSALRKGEVPAFPEFPELPFNGREVVEVKLTPVAVGVLGFRTAPNGHPDNAVLDVTNALLSNFDQTGIIDKLVVDGDIMMAGLFPIMYNDHGASIMFVVPKIIGQSVEKAEGLVKDKIKMVHNGEFSEDIIESIKLNLRKDLLRQWENNQSRVMEMASAFSQDRSWGDFIQREAQIMAVTKEDVIRAAKQYYGDNYLMFISKMGFPKKEKLEKPGFEPVVSKNEVKSEYYQQWSQIPSSQPVPSFVDFENDIKKSMIAPQVSFYSTGNTYNSIFSAEIKFGIGNYNVPELKYAAEYLNIIGTQNKTASELKEALYKLGCSYSFSSTENEFILNLEGMEEKINEAVQLISELLNEPAVDDSKVNKIRNDMKAANKIERREPSHIASALQQYALYGQESSFLRDLNVSQLKKLKAVDLVNALKKAMEYELTINYTGKFEHEEAKNIFAAHLKPSQELKPKIPVIVLERQKINENLVYVVDKKNSTQSQLYFNIEGEPMQIDKIAYLDAFNEYFGANMSSLVFQEIREFRSLAYSAYANYRSAKLPGKNNHLTGFVGCQGDKTMDALEAMNELLSNMPYKPERAEMIRSALIQTSSSGRPGFRNLISTYQKWKEQGYQDDPNKIKLEYYKNLDFNTITDVYEKELKGRNKIITVTGDSKSFDINKISGYGKVIKVKEKDLFVN
jgi:zinc protease